MPLASRSPQLPRSVAAPNRIVFWGAYRAQLPSKGKIRRLLEVGDLTRGR